MATLQQERDFFAEFYGVELCEDPGTDGTEEVEEAIEECKAMLEDAIDRGCKEEISYWRKLLQENKVCRRTMLNA